jgi:uncharacterized membrane protein
MQAKARILGHPIHQMLIVFPLGLLGASVICDIIALAGHPDWHRTAYRLMELGILGGLLAAVFGFVDWISIPSNTRAKRIGALHGVGNVIVTGLFIASWFLRRPVVLTPGGAALALSFVALAIALFTGWLGGELVDRLSIGVDDGAHVNAPSSLSGRPADENASIHRVA